MTDKIQILEGLTIDMTQTLERLTTDKIKTLERPTHESKKNTQTQTEQNVLYHCIMRLKRSGLKLLENQP